MDKNTPSKSNDGRFVAIRGVGSEAAPASAGGHNLRPAWPCAENVESGGSPSLDGGESQEEEVSKTKGNNAPQHRADPFPFATPRIPKRDGPRAEPSSPFAPISAPIRCPSKSSPLTQCLVDLTGN